MKGRLRLSPLMAGVLFLLCSTLAATLADGTIKGLSARLAAPQVFFLSGLAMAGFSLIAARAGSGLGLFTTTCLRTRAPRVLALRSVATVLASVGFFYAIKMLPLAEVFLFIGMMPLISACLSLVILDEAVPLAAMAGLAIGGLGVAMLFPSGFSDLSLGHLAGFGGAAAGTVSLVLGRLMSRYEVNTLVQVFYPNLALGLSAMLLLPAVWHPMTLADLGLVMVYSALLFVARWAMVLVMQRLRAPVALPLMNVQFVWLVAVGFVFFHEVPQTTTLIGAVLVMAAGLIALTQQARIDRFASLAARQTPAVPAE